MYRPSHRLKVEEKKLYRRLVLTVGLFVLIGVFAIFIGLPLFARVILLFSSFRKDQVSNTQEEVFVMPPSINPYFEATNSAKIALSGYGDKDATIRISVNDKVVTNVKTDNEGKFTADNIPLKEGDNSITAIIIKDKHESSPSAAINVVYKKSPPKITINSPKDGDKISGDKRDITIVGETDPGNRITINDRLAIVDQDGKFNFATTLSDGENKFKIKAVDTAGNTAEMEFKVTYNP